MNPVVARRVFYSARSLQGRLDMIKAVLDVVQPKPDSLAPFLRAAIKKAGQYGSTRNMFSHGDAVFMSPATESPWAGQHIIVQGREAWVTDHAAVLTHEQRKGLPGEGERAGPFSKGYKFLFCSE
jgi:hypothetical protein